MRLFFIFALSILILGSCGKKSDPKYQVKVKQEIKIIL